MVKEIATLVLMLVTGTGPSPTPERATTFKGIAGEFEMTTATLEMIQDGLSGQKVSGYHYEPVQPANWADLPQEEYGYEPTAMYEFPIAVGFHDDGYDRWTDDDGTSHSSWDDFPSDVLTGLYKSRKQAEEDLAWDIHNTGAKNLWLIEAYRMSGWQLRTYGAPPNWRSVPHRLVK